MAGKGSSSEESEDIRALAVRGGDFEGEFVVDSVVNMGGTVWVRGMDVDGIGEGGRCRILLDWRVASVENSSERIKTFSQEGWWNAERLLVTENENMTRR
jgi:hypothetical protein